MKIRYDIINSKGKQEPWSGTFENETLAKIWYNKYGRAMVEQGKKLKRVRIGKKQTNEKRDKI